jgi:hypothetical protein
MNNNTLGIIGIVAGSVVALAGIAGMALRKQTDKLDTTSYTSDATSGDAYGIILQISGDDWAKLQDVLKTGSTLNKGADRKKLYRVRPFTSGEPGKPSHAGDFDGGLPTEQLLFDEDAMIKKLQNRKFIGWAFQIGIGGSDNYQKIPSGAVTMPQGRGKVNMRESKEMVEEVNEALAQGM